MRKKTNLDLDTEELLKGIDGQWSSLTIADDFVFGKVMLDESVCRQVLEAILDVSIDRIEYVGRQDDLDVSPEGRGVRLDVHVRDGQGTVYNVEMQVTDTHELPRRSRYYQSLLTLSQLEKGEPYRSLKDSYVIFICGFDLFGEGRRVYSFENRCDGESSLVLGDGSHTIFLAATSPEEPARGRRVNELLDYVASGKVTGELSARLDEAVSEVLDNRKWRLEYVMQVVRDQLNVDKGHQLGLEEGRRLGLEEGRKQGVAEGRKAGMEEGRRAGEAEGRKAGMEEGRRAGEAEGRKAGMEEGRRAGEAEGRKAGEAEGRRIGEIEGAAKAEKRLTELISRLVADGRPEDVARMAHDVAFRSQLYHEYGLE